MNSHVAHIGDDYGYTIRKKTGTVYTTWKQGRGETLADAILKIIEAVNEDGEAVMVATAATATESYEVQHVSSSEEGSRNNLSAELPDDRVSNRGNGSIHAGPI